MNKLCEFCPVSGRIRCWVRPVELPWPSDTGCWRSAYSLQNSAHTASHKFCLYHNSSEALMAHFYWKAFQDMMIRRICYIGFLCLPIGKAIGPWLRYRWFHRSSRQKPVCQSHGLLVMPLYHFAKYFLFSWEKKYSTASYSSRVLYIIPDFSTGKDQDSSFYSLQGALRTWFEEPSLDLSSKLTPHKTHRWSITNSPAFLILQCLLWIAPDTVVTGILRVVLVVEDGAESKRDRELHGGMLESLSHWMGI